MRIAREKGTRWVRNLSKRIRLVRGILLFQYFTKINHFWWFFLTGVFLCMREIPLFQYFIKINRFWRIFSTGVLLCVRGILLFWYSIKISPFHWIMCSGVFITLTRILLDQYSDKIGQSCRPILCLLKLNDSYSFTHYFYSLCMVD